MFVCLALAGGGQILPFPIELVVVFIYNTFTTNTYNASAPCLASACMDLGLSEVNCKRLAKPRVNPARSKRACKTQGLLDQSSSTFVNRGPN